MSDFPPPKFFFRISASGPDRGLAREHSGAVAGAVGRGTAEI